MQGAEEGFCTLHFLRKRNMRKRAHNYVFYSIKAIKSTRFFRSVAAKVRTDALVNGGRSPFISNVDAGAGFIILYK